MSIDYSKPIRTKSEKKNVRILCTDFPGERPIVAQIEGEEEPFLFTRGGSYFLEPQASGWDLENIPPPPLRYAVRAGSVADAIEPCTPCKWVVHKFEPKDNDDPKKWGMMAWTYSHADAVKIADALNEASK